MLEVRTEVGRKTERETTTEVWARAVPGAGPMAKVEIEAITQAGMPNMQTIRQAGRQAGERSSG